MTVRLENQNSFFFNAADDVTFAPSTGTIFLTQNARVTEQPVVSLWNITQLNTSGQFVSSFTSDEIGTATGIAPLPNGNLLVVSTRDARIVEFTKDGQLASGGIDFVYRGIQGVTAITGATYDISTNTIFTVDFRSVAIDQVDTTGKLLNKIDLSASLTGADLQGITIDPISGNLLVVTDDSPAAASNKFYEVTRSGQIISTIDIKALTGFIDAEGISIDPKTRTVYMSFDDDDPTGAKVYDPRRNRVAVFRLETDTFTGDTNTNDNRTGDANDNTILGGGGSDSISGLGGADILDGGLDNDTLNGNQGNDQVLCGAGNDFGRGGDGDDYVGGSTGDDILFGDSGNDNVVGGAGNDTINGNQGDDVINSGDDNDLARGGRGNDYLTGDKGNDTLFGDEGFDTIDGGDGNDSILGGSGEDVLYGGLGTDTLIGGASRDTFILASGTGTDEIADFTSGQDLIGLSGGLTFNQITFTQESANNVITTAIRVAATGEILANVTGVAAASFSYQTFTVI